MGNNKQSRLLEIFYRGICGEDLSTPQLAEEYNVSSKSIRRDIADLKAFLADHRELVGNTELAYSNQKKCYHLYMDEFLTNKEMFALIKIIIGVRAFSKDELLSLVNKLKQFTSTQDRSKLNELIRKEMFYYSEIKHDCESVETVLWKLANCITEKREITIGYFHSDRTYADIRICPVSIMFSEYYFYLIAFKRSDDSSKPLYFRVDRIKDIVVHRKRFCISEVGDFDEGLLRQRSLFMWPGKLRTIRFEFNGPSVQAVLDKLPTAKIIEKNNRTYTVEAEVYGDGIKMWLLSQGHWVKVISPDDFVQEIHSEISLMNSNYTC